jgi:regulation of enolase protein 1 (concanavalin A-like superfamily)
MKLWGAFLTPLAILALACSDDDEPAVTDSAVLSDGGPDGGGAEAGPEVAPGLDAPSVSRDLPPYERAPAPPPISGYAWTQKELGGAALPAGAPPFEVTSAGAVLRSAGTDIGGVADSAGFAFRKLKGDGEIVARVRAVQMAGAGSNATAGVMIRADENDPAAASIFYGMLADAVRGAQSVVRLTKGAAAVAHPFDPGARIGQHFLRIRREGRRFTTARSTDKLAWVNTGSVEIDMPEEVAFGLAAAARQAPGITTPTRGDFDNVRLFGFDAKALQDGFLLETLTVNQTNAGGVPEASMAAGVVTLSGVGDGFTTTFEHGAAVVAPSTGAVTLTAKVESVGDAKTPGARVALTFRDAGNPRLIGSARNVLISVNAAGKVQFQRRDRSTNFDPGASRDGLPPPLWLRLARYEDPTTFRPIVAGFYSADGVAWTQLDAVEYAVADPTLAGVLLTSGAPETYASARLSGLSIAPTTGAPPPIPDAGAGDAAATDGGQGN